MTNTTPEDILTKFGVDGPDELIHYGIPGMRWGQRRSGGSSGGSAKLKTRSANKPERFDKKPPKKLNKTSDQELKKIINRIQMEKQYAQLTAKQSSTAQKFVKETLLTVGKAQAATYGNKAAVLVIEKMLKSAAKAKAARP